MILAIICIAISILLATLFIVVHSKTNGKYTILTKTLASFGFVTSGILAGINLTDNFTGFTLLVIGLLCGMVGDIILSLRVTNTEDSNAYLISGIGAFALGHGLYIAGITVIANAYINVLIPLVVALGSTPLFVVLSLIIFKKLKLNFGKFQLPVILYSFILIFATIFAIGLGVIMPEIFLFAGGLLLILISDVILSLVIFKDTTEDCKNNDQKTLVTNEISIKIKETLLHILYYIGQILIVSFIFFFFYF